MARKQEKQEYNLILLGSNKYVILNSNFMGIILSKQYSSH